MNGDGVGAFVVPAPLHRRPSRAWRPGESPTIHAAGDASLSSAALLATELTTLLQSAHAPRVVSTGCASAVAGDIDLAIDPVIDPAIDPAIGGQARADPDSARTEAAAEGYRIRIDERGVLCLRGTDAAGLYYATRTAIRLLSGTGAITEEITDRPCYRQRGVMLDLGRKHFSVEWIEALIIRMAALKLNTLQLHLSDGLGYRAPSTRNPEIVSPQHLSAAQIRHLSSVAAEHHVRIVPDLDTPAHMDHILAAHPHWRLHLNDGTILPGHLDYSIPAARAFVADLVTEIADLFDSPFFHLGGDEYFPAPWQGDDPHTVTERNAPQLLRHAHAVAGSSASIVDGYVSYLDELVRMLAARGITAKVWSDELDPAARLLLPRTVQVHSWIRWNADKPGANELAAAGYPLVNANGDYLYFILTEHGVGSGPTKSPRGIFEHWDPRVFMGAAGNGADLVVAPEADVVGAHLSIWCDHPEVMDERAIAEAFDPWLVAFSQKVWGTACPVGYDEFVADAAAS